MSNMNLFVRTSMMIIFCISLCWQQLAYAQLTAKPKIGPGHESIENSNILKEHLTIDSAVAIALKKRHEIKAVNRRLDMSRFELKTAIAARYPKLDLLARVSRYEAIDDFEPITLNQEIPGLDESIYLEKNIPEYRVEGRVRLTQLLYSGGRTTSRINAVRENYHVAEMGKRIEARQVALATILACWNLKLTQTILNNTRDAEIMLGDLCKKINNRFKKGTVSRMEWQRAEAELFSVKLAVERALRENRSASDELVITLGLDRNSMPDITIINDESIIPELPDLLLEKIIATALKNHPEILEREKQIQSQAHKIKWHKSRYFPTIEMEGEYAWIGYDELNPGNAVGDLKNDFWAVSVNYRMNLFQGGHTYYSVNAEKERLAVMKENLKGLKHTIAGHIHKFFNLYLQQTRIVKTATYRYEIEKENLDMVFKEFRLGVASIDKVADYHERLLDALRENAAAMVTLQKIFARFQWVSGMELP